MSLLYEVRRRARPAALPLLAALAIGYFGYHAVQGDRGVLTWLQLKQEIAAISTELEAARTARLGLERRVALLKPEGLDRDMLDERARVVLGLAHADEVVFLNE
ncbi:MAG: septum formation initiator family protein [Alphaproteobacteria bacterium]